LDFNTQGETVHIKQCLMFILKILLLVIYIFTPNVVYCMDTTGNATMTRGADLWTETCSHCHNLRPPNEFSARQWKTIMMHMRIQASLTGKEANDIYKFLTQPITQNSTIGNAMEPNMSKSSMMAMPMNDKQMKGMQKDMKQIESKMMSAKTLDDMKKVMQDQMEMQMKMMQQCMDMMQTMQSHMSM
jgi:hypothetical protein